MDISAATVLLALAAVATAWSSYQANRWNGETTKASSRVNALRIEAARAQGLAEGQTQVDIATFIQWVNATTTDEDELRRLLPRTIPTRVPTGLRRLAGDRPTDQPRRPANAVRHGRLPTRSKRRTPSGSTTRPRSTRQIVRRNIQRSANYVLADVLFAVALFFAGMSTKLRTQARAWCSSPSAASSSRHCGVDRHVPVSVSV